MTETGQSSRMLVALLSLAQCACAVGCAGRQDEAVQAEVPVTVAVPAVAVSGGQPPSRPPPRTTEELLEPFAGEYQITRSLIEDGCGGRIVGRAQSLVVDARRGVLYADNPNRFYQATIEGDLLIAERRFDETACPRSTHFARWTLRRLGDGSLDGTVESQWLLPPCTAPCVVRFAIRATRLR